MAKEKARPAAEEVLQDILIVQLALAGLTGHQIRETVGVGMERVTRLVKHLKRKTKNG